MLTNGVSSSSFLYNPIFLRFCSFLCPSFYFFGIVGMELFRGRLLPTNSAVIDSAFGASWYWSNNFDTMPHAAITLFELMVVNNWPITMEGVSAGDGPGWYQDGRWYFIVFYFICVNVVLNVLVAFLIDSYDTHHAVHVKTKSGMVEAWRARLQKAAKFRGFDLKNWKFDLHLRGYMMTTGYFGEGHAHVEDTTKATE